MRLVHPDDQQLVKQLHALGEGWLIAGGTPLRWYQGQAVDSDVDLFFRTQSHFDHMRQQLDAIVMKSNRIFSSLKAASASVAHMSTNAISYNLRLPQSRGEDHAYTVQLIRRRFYDTAEDVLADFDISVCQIVTDGTDIWTGKHFARDVAERRLRMTNLSPNAAKRMVKYWIYGFQPDDDTIRQVLSAPDLQLASTADDY